MKANKMHIRMSRIGVSRAPRGSKLVLAVFIVLFLVSFLPSIPSNNSFLSENISAFNEEREELTPISSGLISENLTISNGMELYEDVSYDFNGSFYDSSDKTHTFTEAYLETKIIGDDSLYANDSIPVNNTETQFNQSIDVIDGSIVSYGNLNQLDNNYMTFNSTFAEHPATYSFTTDADGSDPAGWTVTEGSATINVISNIGGHNKIVEINEGAGTTISSLSNTFTGQTTGYIEWWWRLNTVAGTKQSYIKFYSGVTNLFSITVGRVANKFECYEGGAAWIEITNAVANTWYHFKVSLNADTDTFSIWVNDTKYVDEIGFWNMVDSFDKIEFTPERTHTTFISYIDAVGYSWDENYNIGDNLNSVPATHNSTITMQFTNFNKDLLVFEVSSYYKTDIHQLLNFSIWNFDTKTWILINSSYNKVAFFKSYYSTEIINNYINSTGHIILNFFGENSTSDFELYIDYLHVKITYKLELFISKSFSIKGNWKYRFHITGSDYYSSWVYFEVINPKPNLELISESHVITRWDIYNDSETSLEIYSEVFVGSAWKFGSYETIPNVYLTDGYLMYNNTFPVNGGEVRPKGDADGQWDGLSMSIDNTKLFVSDYNGRLWYSIDSGTTWTEVRPKGDVNGKWYDVEMNSNGLIVFTGEYLGRLWYSIDSGTTWTEVRPKGDVDGKWVSVDMNSDGTKLLAGEGTGRLWYSIDSGTTWTEVRPKGDVDGLWYDIEMNSDGTKLFVGDGNGRLWYSIDSGTTWTEFKPIGDTNGNWDGVSMNSDGTKLLAGEGTGRLWYSIDSGTTWTEVRPKGDVDGDWEGVELNSDGTKLFVGDYNGRLWYSGDSGITWAEFKPKGDINGKWHGILLGYSQTILFVGEEGGRLYYFSFNTSKYYQGDGEIYFQTDTNNEYFELTSNDLSLDLSVSAIITIELSTTSVHLIKLNLYDTSNMLQDSFVINSEGNTNFNAKSLSFTISSQYALKTIKIIGKCSTKQNIRINSIQISEYNLTTYYVDPDGLKQIFYTFGDIIVNIYEGNLLKQQWNISLTHELTTLIFSKEGIIDVYLTYYDFNNEFIDFNKFTTYATYYLEGYVISEQRLSANHFSVDKNTEINFLISDSFNSIIYNQTRGAQQFIDIILPVYSLKIKNEAQEPINYTLTKIITKSGNIFSGEIVEFYIASGNYTFNYTNHENDSFNSYPITLSNHKILIINSTYHQVYFGVYNFDGFGLDKNLFKFYINNTRKDFGFNIIGDYANLIIKDFWDYVIYNQTIRINDTTNEFNIEVQVYNLIINNNYLHNIKVEIYREGFSGNITQIIPAIYSFPFRFYPGVNYNIITYYTNDTVIENRTVMLDYNNKPVNFGFYEELVPVIPESNVPVAILDIIIIIILFSIIVVALSSVIIYVQRKYKKIVRAQQRESRKYIRNEEDPLAIQYRH